VGGRKGSVKKQNQPAELTGVLKKMSLILSLLKVDLGTNRQAKNGRKGDAVLSNGCMHHSASPSTRIGKDQNKGGRGGGPEALEEPRLSRASKNDL